MRSGRRIFKEMGCQARGKLLPFSEFKLFRDLKDRCMQKEFGEYIVSEAEKMLEEEIPFLPLSLYRDFYLTGLRSRFEKKHHYRRKMLFYMTFAEAYEREGRFVSKIADVMWAIMEESGWVIPAHSRLSKIDPDTTLPELIYDSDMPGLDLYGANCCATLALAVHLHGDALDGISPVICRKAKKLILARGIRPFTEEIYSWAGEGDKKCNNWVTNITSSILFACAVTVEDNETRERVVDRAMRFLDNYTAAMPADGVCDEGPGYWSGAGGNYFDCLEIIDDMTGGQITAYGDELVRKMGEYIAELNIDGKYFLNFADAKPRIDQPGKLIMRYGEKCASAGLYSFGKATAATNPIDMYYFFGMAYRVFKDSYIPRPLESTNTEAAVAKWFPEGKVAIFRESGDTSRGFYLAVKGGHNRESHNHKDVGCIVVYYDGKPLIVDPSLGSYDNGFFGPSRYLRWYMKSSYHSIPSPDGYEQEAANEIFASSDEIFSQEDKSISLELKNAFSAEAGIDEMRRTCRLCDGYIHIVDKVVLDHVGEIRFNFTVISEPEIISDGRIQVDAGRVFEFDTNAGFKVEIERIENKNLPYEDLNFKSIWRTDALWRITFVALAKEKCLDIILK